MNYLVILVFALAFFATDCQKNKKDSKVSKDNIIMQTNRVGDLEYKFNLEKVSENYFRLNYEIKNLSKSDYLLYNRGTSLQMQRGIVFVEPFSNDGIELSQKRFFEPKDKDCPDREGFIYAAASLLKAKQTVEEEIGISIPFELKAPFDDCKPQPEMPKEIKKIKFCLGVSKVNSLKGLDAVKDDIILVKGGEDIEKQQLLCSETVELE